MGKSPPPQKQARGRTKAVRRPSKVDDPNRHDISYRWEGSRELKRPEDVRTTAELMAFLESKHGEGCVLEARVMAHHDEFGFGYKRLDKTKFIESFKKNTASRRQFKETFREYGDSFARGGIGSSFSNTVGQDFTPLLGGPFYKQMYYWNDWLKMHQDCFFASNHDPMGKATKEIITDFVMGSGFQVKFENDVAQALWDAFEIANDFQEMMKVYCSELSVYGENMLWWLPDNAKYIAFGKVTKDNVEKVVIPRVRPVDPSNIVEIITYPEDITRVLAYVWLTPTQYQIYTAKDPKTGQVVQGTKFIYQQIPAHEMMHHKVNVASNEKRGRGDYFTALAFGKRLRDSVNYAIIGDQKNSAWSIDTTIQGSDEDVTAYAQAQADLGTIPNAGSEFIHTEAIKRQYLANEGTGSKGSSSSFEWCISMICMSTRIPLSYYGTHLSGGQTRATAIIATEPVAKFFQGRQGKMKGVISETARRLLAHFGIKSAFEVEMPELITQDRTAKLKDLYLGETANWFSPERAATTAAQEMGYRDYDWEIEQEKIKAQKASEPPLGATPLTQPPGAPGAEPGADPAPSSAVTSSDKKKVKDADRS